MAPLVGVRGLVAIAWCCTVLPSRSLTLAESEKCFSESAQGSALLQSKSGLRREKLAAVEEASRSSVLAHLVEEAFSRQNSSASYQCDLCARDWVIILATGRSGSTSVLQMLNAIPGFFLAGEHEGVIDDLMHFWRTVFVTDGPIQWEHNSDLTNFKSSTDNILAWFHPERSQQSTLCALQDAALSLLGAYDSSELTTIGFKEIRYHSPNILDFLPRLFPCARFIVNIRRDISAQASSAFYGEDEEAESKLENGTESLRAWQLAETSKRYLLELESFSVDAFNDLLAWLNVRGCKFTQVAHANDNGGYEGTTAAELVGICSKGIPQLEPSV